MIKWFLHTSLLSGSGVFKICRHTSPQPPNPFQRKSLIAILIYTSHEVFLPALSLEQFFQTPGALLTEPSKIARCCSTG